MVQVDDIVWSRRRHCRGNIPPNPYNSFPYGKERGSRGGDIGLPVVLAAAYVDLILSLFLVGTS